jgi:hypothetical protein
VLSQEIGVNTPHFPFSLSTFGDNVSSIGVAIQRRTITLTETFFIRKQNVDARHDVVFQHCK